MSDIALMVTTCAGNNFLAHFSTEDQALAYMRRRSQHYFGEHEAYPVPDECERLLDALYPRCPHGMSLGLCYGPAHYASEEEIARGW